ncbi:MAG: TetR/AcrR family transcriptional regulator [Microbacteriaceae bacterium]|nr:TetR/AcrR family transcriptional regulator [Microbacteriaceae bacterium]
MPKVSDAHLASRRDQILDAAIACFREQGFQATTMADIIEASGLSAGALYRYFTGKQELAIAAAERVLAGRVANIAAAATAGPLSPAQIIRAIADGFADDGVPAGLVLQLWGEAVTDPAFHAVATRVFGEFGRVFARHLADWAREARGCSEADAAAWGRETLPVLLGLAQGFIVQSALLPGFDRDAYLVAVERRFPVA